VLDRNEPCSGRHMQASRMCTSLVAGFGHALEEIQVV
jgi:hypothetical protein